MHLSMLKGAVIRGAVEPQVADACTGRTLRWKGTNTCSNTTLTSTSRPNNMLSGWLVGWLFGWTLDFAAASLKSFTFKGHSDMIALAAP